MRLRAWLEVYEGGNIKSPRSEDDFYDNFGKYMAIGADSLPSANKGKINTMYLRDFDISKRKAMMDKIESWSIYQKLPDNNQLAVRRLLLSPEPGTITMGNVVRAMMGSSEKISNLG